MLDAAVSFQRLQNQLLASDRSEKPQDVIRWMVAVQSQDYLGAKWAVAQRTLSISEKELDDLFNDGAILRTHVLRPTWHFVLPEDIHWLLKLTAPHINRASSYYFRQVGLDNDIFKRSNRTIAKALRGGNYMTRVEISQVLEKAGIDTSGLRRSHLMLKAELDGVVCSGPLRGKQFTYALLDERAPNPRVLKRDEAIAELTIRYFSSHGPSLVQDYAWWSGLSIAEASRGIEMAGSKLKGEMIDRKRYWFTVGSAPANAKKPLVRLVPNFDEYLVGYKGFALSLSPEGDVEPEAGLNTPHTVILNGQVVGGWRRTVSKDSVTIQTKLRVKLNKGETLALRAAARDYAKFLDRDLEIDI